jgi:hypothetical protein
VLGVVVPVEAMRSAGLTLPLAGTVATALESLGLTFAGQGGERLGRGLPGRDVGRGRRGVRGELPARLSRLAAAGLDRDRVRHPVGRLGRRMGTARTADLPEIADRLPARRPRFGYAQWIQFPLTTAQALSVAIRDGLTVRSLTLMRGLLDNDLLHGPYEVGTPLAPATSCTPGRG